MLDTRHLTLKRSDRVNTVDSSATSTLTLVVARQSTLDRSTLYAQSLTLDRSTLYAQSLTLERSTLYAQSLTLERSTLDARCLRSTLDACARRSMLDACARRSTLSDAIGFTARVDKQFSTPQFYYRYDTVRLLGWGYAAL